MSRSSSPQPDGLDKAVRLLEQAATSKKCWSCACLHGSLAAIERACPPDQRPAALETAVATLRERLIPAQYDCRGCDPCFPPEAMNALGVEGEACLSEAVQERAGWPPLPGSYTILRYQAPVGVCTLTDHRLAQTVAQSAGPRLSIVGTMQTENLGIERVVQNVLANPNIRFLILCGPDSRQAVGHLPGQSLLALASSGIDGHSRIVGARGKRPILRNLSTAGVEHFRRTVEVIDRIGLCDVPTILSAVDGFASRNPGPAKPFAQKRIVPTIQGRLSAKLTPDPAGYFVIYADNHRHVLNMEHYSNEGVLDVVIEGNSAPEVYLLAIEEHLVSRLDHAAYLGRELTRAERSLACGEPYVQDGAPEEARKDCTSGSCCGPGRPSEGRSR